MVILPPYHSIKTEPRSEGLLLRNVWLVEQKLKDVACHLCDLQRRFVRHVPFTASIRRW